MSLREESALVFILKAMIPYSRANIMLAYKPNKFFNELEKISKNKHSRQALQEAMRRAKKERLVTVSKSGVSITDAGLKAVGPFVAKKLPAGAKLMLIFDIPEATSAKRDIFRYYINKWGFVQMQKSVWITNKDFKDVIGRTVVELGIQQYVQLYECSRIGLSKHKNSSKLAEF